MSNTNIEFIEPPHDNVIAVVLGPAGAGKTTMSQKISEMYDILAVDLDIFMRDAIKEVDILLEENPDIVPDVIAANIYVNNIRKYLARIKEPLVLVGFGRPMFGKVYIDIKAKHRFFLRVPDNVLLNQRQKREPYLFYENNIGDVAIELLDDAHETYELWKNRGYVEINDMFPLQQVVESLWSDKK